MLLLHAVLDRVTRILGPWLCNRLVVTPLREELLREWPRNVVGREPEMYLDRLQSHCRLCRRCGRGRQ